MDFYEQKKKQQNVFGNGAGNPNEPDVSFDFDQHLDQVKYEKTVEDIEVQIDMMNLQAEVDQEEKEEQRAKMIENRQRYKKELKEHRKAQKREKQQQILQAEKERTAERMEAIRAKTGTAAVRITKKTVLAGEFKSAFSSKVSDQARLKKQDNKRSRLFEKKNNVKNLQGVGEKVKEEAFEKLKKVTGDRFDKDPENAYDLAAFMTDDKFMNKNILSNLEEGKDKNLALDHMFNLLTDTSLNNVRLDNDKELAAHAKELEKLGWQLAAFESMAGKTNYYASLDKETLKAVDEKLGQLRSIVCYYETRKEVITDPYYMSHYNEELSMDFTAAETEEQKELAKKLTRAYMAGKSMMEKNGASADLMKKQKAPKFKDPEAAATYMTGYSEVIKDTNYRDAMNARLSNEKVNSVNNILDERIQKKYEGRVDGKMDLYGHGYAKKAATYMELLSKSPYVSQNVFQQRFAENTFGYSSDHADLAYDLADKPSLMSKEQLKNHVGAMTHVFKTLKGFDLDMFQHYHLKHLFTKGIGTDQRLVYRLACEAKVMLEEYDQLKKDAGELNGSMWKEEGISDLSEEEIDEVRDHIDAITEVGKVYDVAARFYGSPIAKDYPWEMLQQRLEISGLEEYLRQDQAMMKKYGSAWQQYIDDAIFLRENYQIDLEHGMSKNADPVKWAGIEYRKPSEGIQQARHQQEGELQEQWEALANSLKQQEEDDDDDDDVEIEEDSDIPILKDLDSSVDDEFEGTVRRGYQNKELENLGEGWTVSDGNYKEWTFMPN